MNAPLASHAVPFADRMASFKEGTGIDEDPFREVFFIVSRYTVHKDSAPTNGR